MNLLKVSIATAVVGIIILTALSFYLEPKAYKVSEISENNFGEFVRLTGYASNVKKGSVTQFKLKDGPSEIHIVSFKRVDIFNGDLLEVSGKVDEYKGLLEINAERISKIED